MNRSRALRLFPRAAIGAAIVGLAGYTCASLFWRSAERRNETISVDGATREYLLIVPTRPGAEPIPLVIALHGTGDSPQAMEKYSGLSNLASRQKAIVAYPNAIRGMWKVMDAGPADDNRDIRFMDALIERLASQHNLDAQRIYVVGMSNGASFAQLWAGCRSKIIAAVVAHSGDSPRELPFPERAFPILFIVGSRDTDVTVVTARQAAESYRKNGHPAELTVVDGLGHEWAKSRNAQMWQFLSNNRLKD